jgi:hypothetical protein
LACSSPGFCPTLPWDDALSVHYASEDESLSGDSEGDGIALEEVYSFDRERIATLAQGGACLEELTEAILMDMVGSLERFLTSEQILNMASSGDGTMANVGIKVQGDFPCPLCNQRFDSKHQRQIHSKFVHASQEPTAEQQALLEQAAACARRRHRRSIVLAVKAADIEEQKEEEKQQEEDHAARVTMRRRKSMRRKSMMTQKASTEVDARVQRAVAAAMARTEVSAVLPTALLDSAAPRSRRRASIG